MQINCASFGMKELILLIALVCGFSFMGLPTGGYYCGPATPEERVRYDLESLHHCLQNYFEWHGEAPRSWAELKDLSSGVDLNRVSIDPWGNPYFVQVGWSDTHIRVGTRGRDGELGGKGEDSDRSFDFVLGGTGFAYTETDA